MVRLTTGMDLAANAREGFLDQGLGDYRSFFGNKAPHLVTYYALDRRLAVRGPPNWPPARRSPQTRRSPGAPGWRPNRRYRRRR